MTGRRDSPVVVVERGRGEGRGRSCGERKGKKRGGK